MKYASPGTKGSLLSFKSRYEHFIGNEWVKPVKGRYFEMASPVTGETYTEVARGTSEDVEAALDAAHAAASGWGRTSVVERANILLKIADRMEQHRELLAVAETWGKGKPIRESLAVDLPLSIDHWRYFASAIRTQEGSLAEIDQDTVSQHFYEPLGVVAQIIPWNFPLLMACWKLAPALAAGNCSVLKPAEQTPVSVMILLELIADLLPPGVVNVVQGFGLEAGKPLASSPRVAKVAFTGEAATGREILKYTAGNIVPATLELGGKSPNVFFEDIFSKDDELADKAMEGFSMYAFNQGEVCTCPSRALVQESAFDGFMHKAIARTKAIKVGDPLDTDTMVGALVSKEQFDKVMSYIDIGKAEGAKVVAGGDRCFLGGSLSQGLFVSPTILVGDNKMRSFQEEIFGPVVGVTKFKTFDEAIQIANDTTFGLCAAVWTRDHSTAYRAARAIQAGRVFVNCYHQYPAHAAFGGYKQSGIGRESHKMTLHHYQQIKNVLVNYSPQALGFF
jgi:aldehyde dehydrogenase